MYVCMYACEVFVLFFLGLAFFLIRLGAGVKALNM